MSVRERLSHRVQQELYGSINEHEKVSFEMFMEKTLDILLDEIHRLEQKVDDFKARLDTL